MSAALDLAAPACRICVDWGGASQPVGLCHSLGSRRGWRTDASYSCPDFLALAGVVPAAATPILTGFVPADPFADPVFHGARILMGWEP